MEVSLIQMLTWVGVLSLSLFVLVRGADTFVHGATKIGAYFGMSSFAIGVLIVGFGTSMPELASSLAAVFSEDPEAPQIVLANVVGSNIANILLIVGVLATIRAVTIGKNLLQTELPIFVIATVHFVASVYDGQIDRIEALLLLGTFVAYIWYLFNESQEEIIEGKPKKEKPTSLYKPIAFSVIGVIAVLIGAHFTVEMATNIAKGLSIPIGLVSIAAIAIGTSLPELVVAIQAARKGESEMAIGNIFGSNAFNILLVAGIPGLIVSLPAGVVVQELGLPILVAASFILFVSGLARQVMRWEGIMLLIFFVFFLVKLVAFV
jgi:cation:H+ antiporter